MSRIAKQIIGEDDQVRRLISVGLANKVPAIVNSSAEAIPVDVTGYFPGADVDELCFLASRSWRVDRYDDRGEAMLDAVVTHATGPDWWPVIMDIQIDAEKAMRWIQGNRPEDYQVVAKACKYK